MTTSVATESANIGYLRFDEKASPSTPASGFGLLYFKSDGALYSMADTGVETGPINNDAAVILAPGTAVRNVIQPSSDVLGITLKLHSGETAAFMEFHDSVGGKLSAFDNMAILTMGERDTPTPEASRGKLYPKSTNKLYFQDGTGVEHIVATSIGTVVFNESGIADADIRIETDSEDHFLYIDAGANWLRVGDWDTNYTQWSVDGTQTMAGTARVKKSVWLSATGLNAPHANPASLIAHGLASAWEFSDAIEANQENISALMKVPEDMDRTVAPVVCVGWSADGVSPGDCEWQLEYLWTAQNEDTTGAAQETLTTTSTASATSNGLIIAEFSGVDTPGATDICLHAKVTRLSADAADTISDTTEVSGIAFTYTCNKLGEDIT